MCSTCIFSAQLRGGHGEQQALIVFVLVQELGLLRFCAFGSWWPVVSAFGKGKKFQTGNMFLLIWTMYSADVGPSVHVTQAHDSNYCMHDHFGC